MYNLLEKAFVLRMKMRLGDANYTYSNEQTNSIIIVFYTSNSR